MAKRNCRYCSEPLTEENRIHKSGKEKDYYCKSCGNSLTGIGIASRYSHKKQVNNYLKAKKMLLRYELLLEGKSPVDIIKVELKQSKVYNCPECSTQLLTIKSLKKRHNLSETKHHCYTCKVDYIFDYRERELRLVSL